MSRKFYWISLMLIFLVSLAGCGGGGKGGAPGSTGSTKTGILIQSVFLSGSDNDADSPPDIDAAIHICDDGEPEPGLFAVNMDMTLGATKLNPNTAFDPFPATVEECTITYKKANEDPASPIIESWTVYPNCSFFDDPENGCFVRLIDIDRKVKWWDDYINEINQPSEYPTHYVAVYKCKYINIFGESGYFQTEYDFWIADFNNCG